MDVDTSLKDINNIIKEDENSIEDIVDEKDKLCDLYYRCVDHEFDSFILYLLNKYKLDRTGTVFIDDSEKNINGARAVGIKGVLFDGDIQKLRNELK